MVHGAPNTGPKVHAANRFPHGALKGFRLQEVRKVSSRVEAPLSALRFAHLVQLQLGIAVHIDLAESFLEHGNLKQWVDCFVPFRHGTGTGLAAQSPGSQTSLSPCTWLGIKKRRPGKCLVSFCFPFTYQPKDKIMPQKNTHPQVKLNGRGSLGDQILAFHWPKSHSGDRCQHPKQRSMPWRLNA